jgi:hypothetical protein
MTLRTIQPAAPNPGGPSLARWIPEEARPGRSGEEVLDADLAHIPLLALGHIIPNGTYWFDRDLQIADDGQVFKGTRAAVSKGFTLRTIR